MQDLATGASRSRPRTTASRSTRTRFPPDVEPTHVNLNDGTLEGFRHRALPILAAQFHPEAAPGPHDANVLFDEFARALGRRRTAVNVSLFLARRFLSGRRGGLLGTVSSLALAGVALGTAALVVAMGLMSGYRGELFEKLAGTNAEVLVLPGPDADDAATRATLAGVPGVVASRRRPSPRASSSARRSREGSTRS